MQKINFHWKQLFFFITLYLMFCAFLWSFLLVQTRSYNRLSHEPVTMAQITISADNTAYLRLADTKWEWKFPRLGDDSSLWICTLPCHAANAAVCTWQLLWRYA